MVNNKIDRVSVPQIVQEKHTCQGNINMTNSKRDYVYSLEYCHVVRNEATKQRSE